MTEAKLDADDSGKTLRVALRGEIDMVNVGTVDGDIRALISNRHTDVVLDLAELTHLDSSGLRMLFSLGTRLEVLQIRFHLDVPWDAPSRRVIELSGIATIASVRPGSRTSS
jgi:anti-anti-sigma factor